MVLSWMNYYNDLTSRRQWNGWDWAQKSVNDVMEIPWDPTGSRCISRISPSRCLQVTRRCRPLFDISPDDSICAAALKRSQVPPIFGFPPGVQTGCPECLRLSILELNPTVLVGFVIFWEKIRFTLGMGENSCPQMDGFIKCFILEMTKARGT